MGEERPPAPLPPAGQILIYRDGATNLQVRLDGQTVWLTQAAMAELYQTTPQNVTIHLKSIYDEGELDETATCKEYLQVRLEGTRHVLEHANAQYALHEHERRRLEAEQPASDFDRVVQQLTNQQREAAKPIPSAKQPSRKPRERRTQ
jgi:hypothetical protein